MKENPEAQEPRKDPSPQDQRGLPPEVAEEVDRVVREASQAETDGRYALASLLALHALQLDPGRTDASGIFERSQAVLGRKDTEPPPLPQPRVARDLRDIVSTEVPLESPDDALRHAIDLDGVPPLIAAPRPRGLGSRLFRAMLPFLVIGLLVAGIWLASGRSQTPVAPPVAARPAVAQPVPAADDPDIVADSAPAAATPGTVVLNIIPWAKVDAIYSVYDGHEIEPDGLVSPCTVSLPPGRYSFTLSHPDFGTIELPVIVKSGQVTKVEHSLISNQELEKELGPALKSAGYPAGRVTESRIQQSAALRR